MQIGVLSHQVRHVVVEADAVTVFVERAVEFEASLAHIPWRERHRLWSVPIDASLNVVVRLSGAGEHGALILWADARPARAATPRAARTENAQILWRVVVPIELIANVAGERHRQSL